MHTRAPLAAALAVAMIAVGAPQALAAAPSPSTGDVSVEEPQQIQQLGGPEELTHGPLVPVMLRTATDVPDEIRPGSWIVEPAPCTLAHVVADGSGDLYALTAGHCVDPGGVGSAVVMVTEAGPTGDAQIEIGEVVSSRNAGPGEDFALVAIHDDLEHRVNPNMVGWQGPTGLATESQAGTVHHYGFGSAATWAHHTTRCRTGATLGAWSSTTYNFQGVVAFGDSGSPAQTADGEALGINTHISPGSVDGVMLGTRADHALDQLDRATGLSLSIVTGDAQTPVCQVTG